VRRHDDPDQPRPPGIPLTVYHIAQDDPKRNTARKLARFSEVRLTDKIDRVPRGALLLDPYASKALSPEDVARAQDRGLVALDCSWRHAEEVFPAVRKRTEARALPYLLAANPVNFGKAFQLSTAEALAASCHILAEPAQAERLMSKFIWGPTFLSLNANPLRDYASARTSREVVAHMHAYVPDEDDSDARDAEDAKAGDAGETREIAETGETGDLPQKE